MKAKITFEVEIPNGATKEEAEAWLRFELHDRNEIDSRHPLLLHAVEPSSEVKIEFED